MAAWKLCENAAVTQFALMQRLEMRIIAYNEVIAQAKWLAAALI